MTKLSPEEWSGERRATRCAWCSRALPDGPPKPVGRPRVYCRRSCRQRAFEARHRGQQLGLGDDELVIARNELDDANDRLFEISVAVRQANERLDDGVAAAKVLRLLLEAVDAVVGTN